MPDNITPPPNEADDATTDITRAQLEEEARQNAAARAASSGPAPLPIQQSDANFANLPSQQKADMIIARDREIAAAEAAKRVPQTPPVNESEIGSTTTTMEQARTGADKSGSNAALRADMFRKPNEQVTTKGLMEGTALPTVTIPAKAEETRPGKNSPYKTFATAENLPDSALPLVTRLQMTRAETKAIVKELGPQLPTLAKNMAVETVVSMIPIVGTAHEIQKAWEDKNITPGEATAIIVSAGLDALTLIPITSGVGAAARATGELGRATRIVAGAKTAAKLTLAEAAAPIYMLKHPIKSVKELGKAAETVLPRRLPLAGVEVSYSTVRLPAAMFDTENAAKVARNAVTIAAEKGTGAAKVIIGNQEVELSRAAIQRLGTPLAASATPDVRPFLKGAVIQEGREGGLFVAPNVHTRFSAVSAFGDKPAGGIPGALLIRDEKVLKQLVSSDKIFTPTGGKAVAEIESVIPASVKLPAPSQTLFTRDANGQLMTLLVFGKKYSPAEVAKLKFMGSMDTVKQVFTPAAKISNVNGLSEEAAAQVKSIEALAGKARKAGDAAEVARLERRMDDIIQSASGTAGAAFPVRMLVASTNGRPTALEKWRTVTGATGEELPEIVLPEPTRTKTDTTTPTRATADIAAPDGERVPTDTTVGEPARAATEPTDGDTERTPEEPADDRTPPTDTEETPPPDRTIPEGGEEPAAPARVAPPAEARAPVPVSPVTPPGRAPAPPRKGPPGAKGSILPPERRTPPVEGTPEPGRTPFLPDKYKKGKKSGSIQRELTPADLKGAYAWKQGFGWYIALKDGTYRFVRKLPDGISATGRTPDETVQRTHKGKLPATRPLSMGIVTAKPERIPDKPGTGNVDFSPRMQKSKKLR